VPGDVAERLLAQAARFGRADLSRAADLVATGLTEMRGATSPRMLLELICARVLLPGADDSTQGVFARLDRLERRMAIEAGTPSTRPAARPAASSPSAQPTPVVEPQGEEPREGRAAVAVPLPEASASPRADPPGPGPSSPADGPREPAAEAATALPAGLTLVEVRRLWPDLLESVKLKRRFTWIMLSQNAQVVSVDGTTLTIALVNAGARESFLRSASDEILRQAAIDVIGQDWKVEAIVDPSNGPGAAAVAAPPPRRPPGVDAVVPAAGGSDHAAAAGTAGTTGTMTPTEPTVDGSGDRQPEEGPADSDAHRDDPDADDPAVSGAELLERELGAQVIEEILHE
jgi:DNA polymerase-3 subunit gamma/tau